MWLRQTAAIKNNWSKINEWNCVVLSDLSIFPIILVPSAFVCRKMGQSWWKLAQCMCCFQPNYWAIRSVVVHCCLPHSFFVTQPQVGTKFRMFQILPYYFNYIHSRRFLTCIFLHLLHLCHDDKNTTQNIRERWIKRHHMFRASLTVIY